MNTPVDLNGVCLEKHWLTHDFVCIRMEIIISSSLFSGATSLLQWLEAAEAIRHRQKHKMEVSVSRCPRIPRTRTDANPTKRAAADATRL